MSERYSGENMSVRNMSSRSTEENDDAFTVALHTGRCAARQQAVSGRDGTPLSQVVQSRFESESLFNCSQELTARIDRKDVS